MPKTDTADHHGSHRNLLWQAEEPAVSKAQVDAIIVPTARSPAYLKDAVGLAIILQCPLVTLHSRKWTSAQAAVRRFETEKDLDLVAIDLPIPASLRLPTFETASLLSGTRFARSTDTSTKRNLALTFSHMMGWKRIAFLDDDIIIRHPDHLRYAAGLLDTYNAVGLSIGGYPDNSVVCHAYREVGGQQDSFIGGGALITEVNRTRSFFPDIYNDDWFYMLDAEKGLQPVAVVGEVVQRKYDPFRNPDRARSEELGDVLAEGTFWLLDQGGSIKDADLCHWNDFLMRRGSFIERVLDMVTVAPDVKSEDRARMTAALKASRGRLAHITPELCQNYLWAWTTDRRRWQRHLDELPAPLTLESAVRSLTGSGQARLVCKMRTRSRRRPLQSAFWRQAEPIATDSTDRIAMQAGAVSAGS